MYLDYYKLKSKPFQITVDPKFLWLGEKHKEALATLRYGIVDNRGFLLLTGEVGTGKTILINRLVSTLNVDTVVAALPDPDLESMDFYNLLADGLRMNRTFDNKASFLIALRDFLHQSYANKKHVLLIIDESQRLSHRLMEDIRVLSNIELQDRKLINIFFVGQQEFNAHLNMPQNRALAQRITVRYHIEALDAKETGQYIVHRLRVAGAGEAIFDSGAVAEIHNFSGGIPRLINIVCDHALLTGYARDQRRIDGKTILECARELRIPGKKGANPNTNRAAVIKEAPSAMLVPDQKADPVPSRQDKRAGLKFLYAALILMLGAAGALAVNHFTGDKWQLWGDEDPTPRKYIATPESEKELLQQRIEKNDPALTPRTIDPIAPVPLPIDKSPQEPNPGEPVDQRASVVGKIPPAAGSQGSLETMRSDNPDRKVSAVKPLPVIQGKSTIYFTVNSNDIDQKSYPELDRIAEHMVANPSDVINIRGYTDSSGSSGYNESVSRFRANTVKSYLIGKGVSPENINIFAMGGANPIGANDTQEGRRLNRRVEIEFPGN